MLVTIKSTTIKEEIKMKYLLFSLAMLGSILGMSSSDFDFKDSQVDDPPSLICSIAPPLCTPKQPPKI
jgi:hypothetical protein